MRDLLACTGLRPTRLQPHRRDASMTRLLHMVTLQARCVRAEIFRLGATAVRLSVRMAEIPKMGSILPEPQFSRLSESPAESRVAKIARFGKSTAPSTIIAA